MPAAAPRLLEPIHPNPLGSPGESHSLPEGTRVRLAVYDVQGETAGGSRPSMKPAGRHASLWDGRAASGVRLESGVYLVRLELGDRTNQEAGVGALTASWSCLLRTKSRGAAALKPQTIGTTHIKIQRDQPAQDEDVPHGGIAKWRSFCTRPS